MPIDSQLVIYTGVATSTVPILPNQELQLILQNIDTAINTHNTAPDYSGYDLGPYFGYTITQTDGSSHPTNTQNFAEGISKILCKTEDDLYTFTGTTYPADQAILTAAINAIQTPGLTYSHSGGGVTITITNTMTTNQTLTAIYSPLGDVLDVLAAPGSNWSTLSITTPTDINTAFNDLIAYLSSLTTTVSGKQAQISTFDNTGNCLAGGATDSIYTTVGLLITYACGLPTFSAGSITWGGVASQTTLQDSVQAIINSVSSTLTNAVVAVADSSITLASVGTTYQGKKISLNTANTQLYKVMVTGDAYTDADFLDQKVESSDSSITISVTGNKLDLVVASAPNSDKVKVNSSDTTAGYLVDKVTGGSDSNWGLSIGTSATTDNSMVQFIPSIANPNLTWQAMMSFIASDPTLLIQFANLVAISQNVPGLAITDLIVTLTTGDFVFTWTAQSGVSQQAKWRIRGNALWNTGLLSPANPLSAVAVTTTFSPVPLNIPIQCQVDTIYATGIVGSNIYEMIRYSCQSDTHSATGGVISISQPAVAFVDTIEYNLIDNSGPTTVQTIITSGAAPAVVFSSVSAGTYHVEWRYSCTINGSVLYSDDPSQLNAMCASSNITI